MNGNFKEKTMRAKYKLFLACIIAVFFLSLVSAVGITYAAKAASWDVVPIDKVNVTTEDSLSVRPGGSVRLSSTTVPEYAIYTAGEVRYDIVSGSAYSNISGSTLHINENAQIGSEIIVRSVIDGVVSQNTLTFKVVKIPVQSVKILNTESRIEENTILPIITQVLPANASYGNVVYSLVDGGRYASVGGDGIIRVKNKLPGGDLTIRVRATCANDNSIYDEKTFDLYVPVREIIIGNANITEVEQRRTYNFNGMVGDTVSDSGLTYSINVGDEVATVSDDGILTVSDDAPIGSEIIISIVSADLTVTHKVKVVTVYATSIRLDGVINQDGAEVLERDKVYAEDVLSFDVAFPTPFNVTESQKNYMVELFSGNTEAAEISLDGKSVIIKPQDRITVRNPEFTVKISSIENPAAAAVYRTFKVHIKVTDISTSALVAYADEGEVYAIEDLIHTEIFPDNSDVRGAVYTIEDGGEFAYITDNRFVHITGKDNLPNGNCRFSIMATAEGYGSTQSFTIYIKAEKINYTIENLSDPSYPENPMSTKTVGRVAGMGEKMRIAFYVDSKATARVPVINIKEGSDLIADYNYDEGVITFNVVPDAKGSLIKFEAQLDDLIVSVRDIVIYKPVQDISAVTDNYESDSGRYLVHRDNASKNVIRNLNMGTKWTVSASIGSVDLGNRSRPILQIPVTTKAGTAVKVTVYTNDDRCQFSKEFTFYVAKLDVSIFKYGVGGNIISFPYGKDSAGISIKQEDTAKNYKPQLWVGRSTTVNITTSNGLGLSYYGLKATGTTISMPSSVSGNYSFAPKITITDGTDYNGSVNSYVLTLPTIHAFRPLSGVPKLVDGNVPMTTNDKVLELRQEYSSFSSIATYKLSDLVMSGSKLSGAKLVGRKLTITSDHADSTQIIILSCAQYYNGVELTGSDAYFATVTQKVKRVTLDRWGGHDGTDSILAVDGMQTSISTPSKTGYKFSGYYTGADGRGQKYYDANGKLAIQRHSDYSANALYAYWTPITYKVKCDVYVNDKYQNTAFESVWTYDHTYIVSVENEDGFKHFLINGITYEQSPKEVSNLTTTDGATVTIYAYFENSCVASGTLITLADGTQKAVEDLDGSEMLLVWNMFTGKFDAAPILFIDSHGEREYDVTHLFFSDGTDVKIIAEHGFWDFDLNRYVYVNGRNAEEYIGHWFNKQYIDESGELRYKKVQFTNVTYETEWTNAWSPVTYGHLCYYVNGMLSVPDDTDGLLNYFIVDPDTLKYDEEAMKADIELYGLFDYEADFAGIITKEMFDAFNGKYLKIAIAKGILTEEKLNKLIENYLKFFNENPDTANEPQTHALSEVAYDEV